MELPNILCYNFVNPNVVSGLQTQILFLVVGQRRLELHEVPFYRRSYLPWALSLMRKKRGSNSRCYYTEQLSRLSQQTIIWLPSSAVVTGLQPVRLFTPQLFSRQCTSVQWVLPYCTSTQTRTEKHLGLSKTCLPLQHRSIVLLAGIEPAKLRF